MEYRKRPEYSPSYLFSELKSNYKISDRFSTEETWDTVARTVAFKENVNLFWVIKRINGSLYLLIPKKYLSDIQISETDTKKHITEKTLTNAELKCGLRINHMHTLENVVDIIKPVPTPRYADYFSESLEEIFVTTKEYYVHHDKNIPQWIFCIRGHGTIKEAIAYLSIQGFRTLLTFLETKIRTKLFYYDSCYDIGINSDLVYADLAKKIDKNYSFPITDTACLD